MRVVHFGCFRRDYSNSAIACDGGDRFTTWPDLSTTVLWENHGYLDGWLNQRVMKPSSLNRVKRLSWTISAACAFQLDQVSTVSNFSLDEAKISIIYANRTHWLVNA